MSFTVVIPARMASSRLPRKPLADIAGLPMIVRVARRAAASSASRVVVAADHADIAEACARHGVDCILTAEHHVSGSDRLAEAAGLLGLAEDAIVVNVQGDEPLIDPVLVDACARLLAEREDCVMSTAAHAIDDEREFNDPNVVKVVCDRLGSALYFSRAPIPWWRDGLVDGRPRPGEPAPLRHIGLYAYRAGYLKSFSAREATALERCESLEQLRALWHGDRIAVHVTTQRPGPGVDTPADLERVRRLCA